MIGAMKIGTRTKISDILRHNIGAVEAIAAINPHFNKLRNPILRRVLAPRVTVADAARIGKCAPSDILERLRAIGFDIEDETPAAPGAPAPASSLPGLVEAAVRSGRVRVLDVRPVLESGKDPFQLIMAELKTLPEGHALEVVNSFEPVPLIAILGKQGFSSGVEHRGEAVHTFFLKTGPGQHDSGAETGIFRVSPEALEAEKARYQGRFREIDVRDLEMPLPMMTILSELETLPDGEALYVHHKKVPQYLLPELAQRRYKTWIAELGEGNVKMLIKR